MNTLTTNHNTWVVYYTALSKTGRNIRAEKDHYETFELKDQKLYALVVRSWFNIVIFKIYNMHVCTTIFILPMKYNCVGRVIPVITLYERETFTYWSCHYGLGENYVSKCYIRKVSVIFSFLFMSEYLRRNNIYQSLLEINFCICFLSIFLMLRNQSKAWGWWQDRHGFLFTAMILIFKNI